MFYNQFNNNNCCNLDEKENNKTKGYCTVKVIQECCYPSYFDLNNTEEKCDKHEDRPKKCCCEKESYEKDCSCHKKDDWNDTNPCQCHKKEDNHQCRNDRRSCGLCSCFRRW